MTSLTFTDGVHFDLSGELRIESRHDGLYVVGRDQLIPISSEEEGRRIIEESPSSKQKITVRFRIRDGEWKVYERYCRIDRRVSADFEYDEALTSATEIRERITKALGIRNPFDLVLAIFEGTDRRTTL